jgi:transaldolase
VKSFHLYLDSADLGELSKCMPHPVVYGITTNPSILKRDGVSRAMLPGFFEKVFKLGAKQVQAQVHAATTDAMLADAQTLISPFDPGRVVVKIPATRDGLRAGAELAAQGVPVTFTAVYALEQAHFAAQLGAAYAAPYFGKLEDVGFDGLRVITKMQAIIERSGADTRLLAASIRSREAYLALLKIGIGAITIPTRLFPELLDHPATIEAERLFLADAQD